MQRPLLSIVVATWNRSNVLRLSIEAALRSTITDWEMLVIGDACTDDTAEVVASFDDARISFHNLAVNHGEQSTPNNEGIRMARGRYVALLNHDDLWTDDHLATCLEAIEREAADLVFTLTISFDYKNEPFLGGVTGSDRYTPYAFIPASSWLFRRELFDEVGPWRPAWRMIAVPSQEWLFRAHRMGKRLLLVHKVTLVSVGSGSRHRSYANREIEFNAAVARGLRDDPDFLQTALTHAAARATLPLLGFAVLPHLVRAAKNAVRRIIAAAGGNPNALAYWLHFGGRGGYVDQLRKIRGLSPLPRRPA